MDEKLTVDVDTVVYFDWKHQREVGERKILKTLSDIYQRKNFAEKGLSSKVCKFFCFLSAVKLTADFAD